MTQRTRWIGLAICLTAGIVHRTANTQCHLVVDLFRSAPTRLGIRRNRGAVAVDRGDHSGILPLLEGRRLVADAVFGLGWFRRLPELHDLEVEFELIE